MKRFLAFAAFLVMVSVCLNCVAGLTVPVWAGSGEAAAGEVLYHQDFSVLSELEKSGIVRGTSSAEKSIFTCEDSTLELNPYDNGRIYALLPRTDVNESYTVEFDFSFSDVRSQNGYLAFLLTCRGTEPTNITALVIRADGTVDDFAAPDEAFAKKIACGETVHVKIPVKKNVFHKIELSIGEEVCTLERDSVQVIEEGTMGFAARNASVQIAEIFVVSGVDYEKRTGFYAAESYASDEAVVPSDRISSPQTADFAVPCAVLLSAAAAGLFRRRAGKR
ncbi:MAG: hypothetical protein ACI4V1_01730 [Eubacteriales bacterium]